MQKHTTAKANAKAMRKVGYKTDSIFVRVRLVLLGKTRNVASNFCRFLRLFACSRLLRRSRRIYNDNSIIQEMSICHKYKYLSSFEARTCISNSIFNTPPKYTGESYYCV